MAEAKTKDFQHLKFAQFKELGTWDYYTLFQRAQLSAKFPLVKLGTVLKQRKGSITIDNSTVYKRCKVQLYGRGVVLRDEVLGAVIKTKRQQRCKPDDFLVAEIDAKFGGYGIVPTKLEDAIVSSHYFLFELDKAQLLPAFLSLVIKLSQFSNQVKATGSTNYAAIRPFHVLNYQIPLPSLSEQDTLTASYNEKLQLAQSKEVESNQNRQRLQNLLCNETGVGVTDRTVKRSGMLIMEYKYLTRWSLDFLLRAATFSFSKAVFPVVKIGQIIIRLSGGHTPSTSRVDFWGGKVNWTSPKDFNGTTLSASSDRITAKALAEAGLQLYPAGTVMAVFRSGILRHSFPIAITTEPTAINQDLKAIIIDKLQVMPKYFLYYLHCFQSLVIEQASKKSVTVESINVAEFLNLPFVLPPMDVQEKIIEAIEWQMNENTKKVKEASELKITAIQEFEQAIFHL